jgi:hypothetical protein
MLGTGVALAVAGLCAGIPSFSRQTGLRCNQCHTAFPYLTQFGRRFKVNGYTLTGLRLIEAGEAGAALKLDLISPVSAALQAGVTRVATAPAGSPNDVVEFPQQASLFLGEAITPALGAFLELSYRPAAGRFAVGEMDIRYAGRGSLGAREVIYGLSLNNDPGVQDPWHSTPVWSFPFAVSPVAPAPRAATLLDRTLAQQVAGLGAYALWDNTVYGEFSVYRSAPQGGPHPPTAAADRTIRGVAPYWRVALQHGWRNQSVALGCYGMVARLYPSGVTGPSDRYADVALDAQYERRVESGIVASHATWIYERQALDASFASGRSANPANTLRTLRADASYYAAGRVGVTLAYIATTGDRDPGLYPADSPVAGSRTGRPDSNSLIGEVDFLPWLNTRFALQYVLYTRFNGAGNDYSGFGRDAADNNTLYGLVWLAF